MNKEKILLPGLDKQINFLRKNLTSEINSALVIGSASEIPAEIISKKFNCKIEVIVEDYESLLNSRLILSSESNVNVRLMSFEATDFNPSSFDLVYAQASISSINRNKVVKEIKRILLPDGFFCVGEVVTLKRDVPQYVQDIFDASDLLPLFVENLEKYYSERKFVLSGRIDLTNTLNEYFLLNKNLLSTSKENLTEREKSYYKKLLNKINHESNAYLKLGADKFIGFLSLLLKKGHE
ncbi:MAG: methyltransferase domain-containing protein [Ignavibacteriales bacterium]|nr:MAG: methyltransferase domain-containing protein [Ignavibacteriales bacterium]